jgi:phosphomannomutase
MLELFKAYDIRGKVGVELTTELCEKVGRAFADWLPESGIVAVGRDMRPDSKELSNSLIEGLRLQGRTVWDLGEITTDMLYFAVGHFALAGGAMVTASHNPGEYNGIKFCREEARAIGIESGLADIRDAVIANDFVSATKEGKIRQRQVVDEWIKHVLSFVDADHWPKYEVGIDAGNGMAGAIIPELAKQVPLHIHPLYFELDGSFPNHLANPLDESTLVDLQKLIRTKKLTFGIAFDADGDRARLLDERGIPLSGTTLTCILAEYLLKKSPGAAVLYNAICGRAVKEIIEENGGHAFRTRVGHSFIKADMRTHDAILAGEHSGHFYFRDNFYADSGLIAALVAIQAFAGSDEKTVSAFAAKFKRYEALPEKNFTVTDKEAVMQKVSAKFDDGQQDWLDGLTVNYPNGWFNVRASNTEPVLRLNVEAEDEKTLHEMAQTIEDVILSLAQG